MRAVKAAWDPAGILKTLRVLFAIDSCRHPIGTLSA